MKRRTRQERSLHYGARIALAAALSFVVHISFLAAWPLRETIAMPVLPPDDTKITLNFVPEHDEQLLRLVESGAPTQTPSINTDLISDKSSRAQDMSDVEGERPQPFFEETRDFDELAVPAPAPVEESPPPVPAPSAAEAVSESNETQVAAVAPRASEDARVAAEVEPSDAIQVVDFAEKAAPEEEEPKIPELEEIIPDEEPPLAERFEVAQAEATPQVLTPDPGTTVGRAGGGVQGKGFASFEANQHIVGPYMMEVRRRVERVWKLALRLRYSGTSPTDAVVECSISPRGELVFVRVVEPGDSVSFAYMCKDAIERSGPFPPFPFKVPSIYRNKNLEIRWRFTFL